MKQITDFEELKKTLDILEYNFIDKLTAYEKADRPTITEKECEIYFLDWWKAWIHNKKERLDTDWHAKRASYIMLQLAFIELKKREKL